MNEVKIVIPDIEEEIAEGIGDHVDTDLEESLNAEAARDLSGELGFGRRNTLELFIADLEAEGTLDNDEWWGEPVLLTIAGHSGGPPSMLCWNIGNGRHRQQAVNPLSRITIYHLDPDNPVRDPGVCDVELTRWGAPDDGLFEIKVLVSEKMFFEMLRRVRNCRLRKLIVKAEFGPLTFAGHFGGRLLMIQEGQW